MTAQASHPVTNGVQERIRRNREIITPEGVRLHIELADRAERAAAVALDLLIMLGIVFGVLLMVLALISAGSKDWGVVIFLILFFFVRNFYFTFFELRWHGRTPGKRMLGLRVIDRNGGTLKSDAVFARNLTREVELFIPIALALAPQETGLQGWGNLLALAWASIFLLMPLFNKDSLRMGDMIAGTWVVIAPKTVLMPDLSGPGRGLRQTMRPSSAIAAAPAKDDGMKAKVYDFTDAQLDIYGIYELQALEEVLRRKDPKAPEVRAEVCKRICKKIDFTPKEGQDIRPDIFLDEFYLTLRKRLETRMLLGQRRESQHDT